LISPPDPPFFGGLCRELDDVAMRTTARQKGRTVPLARELDLDHVVLGRDFDDPFFRKLGIPLRTTQLALRAPESDVSLSARNAMCLLASKARGIPSIHFTDNDITAHVEGLRAEELYVSLEATATHTVVPAAFATEELTDRGADPASIHSYDGYKEEVYVADFDPDPRFTERLPFESGYVVLRPEALTAAYVDVERSIVPDLLALLVDRGFDVVYLPRGRDDEAYAAPYPASRVFVPEGALDGLQLAWHARCVLTGSGTMGREAAAMGKPAVSFFPSALLSVDMTLREDGRPLHSRDPHEIVASVEKRDEAATEPDRSRARETRTEVVEIVSTLLDSIA
jgi:predicted glycosyltransferase